MVHTPISSNEATSVDLVADTVAKVAEQRRTQRAGDERDAEGQERREHLRRAGGLREEHRADHGAAAVA